MYSIKSNKAKKLKSIRARLTMVYSTLFGLFLCVFAYIISGQYLSNTHEEFDKALLNYAIDLASEIKLDAKSMTPNLKIPDSELQKNFPFSIGQTYYWVRSIDGKIILTGREGFILNEVPYKSDLALKEDYTHRYLDLEKDNEPYRALNLKITDTHGEELIFQVATSSSILKQQARSHFLVNFITIPLC